MHKDGTDFVYQNLDWDMEGEVNNIKLDNWVRKWRETMEQLDSKRGGRG